jgi:hypothetical protein
MRIPPEKQGYRKLVTIHSALRLASRRTDPGLNPLGSQLLDDGEPGSLFSPTVRKK